MGIQKMKKKRDSIAFICGEMMIMMIVVAVTHIHAYYNKTHRGKPVLNSSFIL